MLKINFRDHQSSKHPQEWTKSGLGSKNVFKRKMVISRWGASKSRFHPGPVTSAVCCLDLSLLLCCHALSNTSAQTRLTPLSLYGGMDIEWHNFLFPPRISFKLPGCVYLLLKLTKTKFEGNLTFRFCSRVFFICLLTPPEGRETTTF